MWESIIGTPNLPKIKKLWGELVRENFIKEVTAM